MPDRVYFWLWRGVSLPIWIFGVVDEAETYVRGTRDWDCYGLLADCEECGGGTGLLEEALGVFGFLVLEGGFGHVRAW